MVDERFAGQSGPCGTCGKTITVPYSGGKASGATVAAGAGIGMGVVIAILGGVIVAGGCVIAILAALLLPAVSAARTAAKRTQSMNNLKQIGLALHNYHDVNGSFPPAYVTDANGKKLYSWRVLILPYLEQNAAFQQFDKTKAWDAPENIAISNMAIPAFQSPADESGVANRTNYVAMVGPNTLFPPDRGVKMFEVTDGTANTIAVIETKNVQGSWAAPIDPDLSTMSFTVGSGQGQIDDVFPGGRNVLMTDASVRFVGDSMAAQMWQWLFTRNDGQSVYAE